MQRERISELEAIATGCTGKITGIPGGNSKSNSDKIGRYAAQIADLRCLLDLNLKKGFFELNRLTQYIQDIDDSLVRQIMTYRFIYGFNWQKTALIIGGNNKPDALRIKMYRYLKNRQLS